MFCFYLCCTFWASYWHIKCKINWERTFKRLPNWNLSERLFLFLRFSKEVQKKPLEVFYKDVFKNSAIVTEIYLCCSLFIKKLQTFRTAILLKETPTQMFFWEYLKMLKNFFFTEYLLWLVLNFFLESHNTKSLDISLSHEDV